MKPKYVFGPTPSRRLGRSLGIDPVPLKTCNWNCVYCQLGRSVPLVGKRAAYFPKQDILDELRHALGRYTVEQLDCVTFVGSGEPLLHTEIGEMIREVHRMTRLPVAVCTNGALLYLREVRDALREADIVIPTVNAGSREMYKRVNRPHASAAYESHVGGLIAFANEFEGQLWPEVMLIRGLNDTERALLDLRIVLRQMRPSLVHINLPTRATAETWVEPADEEAILRAMAILGDVAEVVHPADVPVDLSGYDDVVQAALAIIERHPLRESELETMLNGFGRERVAEGLAGLSQSDRVQLVERFGVRFWCPAGSYYPDEERSRRAAPH